MHPRRPAGLMLAAGIGKVFTMGTEMSEIVAFIREWVAARDAQRAS